MVRSRKERTISIRKLIIFLHSSGKSVRYVAKLVNLSHSTGQYVIKRFKEENRIENKVRKGRPAMLTQRDQRFIIRKFVKNPSLSALKVSAVFNEAFSTTISPETVRRVLRAAGLVTYGGRGAFVWECMSASGLERNKSSYKYMDVYGSEAVILNRNHDAAESVNPIPIHESRFRRFMNSFLRIRSFWLESDISFLLRSRIRGFVPE
ncbi:hypothetical protein AVEN_141011-1 [Araneus ventricosus]|uniref:Transposase Tc1-like domain-containing protein n=1 Tax=Araneus ventricosus TaxID=182803 RepID=A0A4Y2KKA3_ARAVE|nr:hypothetical protein AVEN_141011-1 [Araneus ventricosus]